MACNLGRGCLLLVLISLGMLGGAQVHHKHRRVASQILPTHLSPAAAATQALIKVDVTQGHVLNTFSPVRTFGAALDSIGGYSFDEDYSAFNKSKILPSGLGNISYRLYTELSVQDWHWNPTGTWSDAAHQQGYFVGSSEPTASPINHSYGYALPHRGSTYDQGDGLDWSRIDDGDPNTYWKSNPYLTSAYTRESDALHPQWVLADVGAVRPINAIQIQWANPYAVIYRVQYWTAEDAIGDPTDGSWVDFPNGVVTNGSGGKVTLRLASAPVSAEFIRVLMFKSSNTFDTHGSGDPRNGMGYAVSELGVGTITAHGKFTDDLVHSKSVNQSPIYVSSVDPWHDGPSEVLVNEQPGLDYVLRSSLTQGLPSLVPVANVYGVPEDAVAEVGYLVKQGYPLLGIEIGEEADGQYMTPEDYASLYLQWSTAIHKAYPNVKIGGPVISDPGASSWPDATGDTDYLRRFIGYLSARHATSLVQFLSMEQYPFSSTVTDWTILPQEAGMVQSLYNEVANSHAPAVPLYVSEYNLNALTSEAPVDLIGALWHALFLGEFLKGGGQDTFFYEYLPLELLTDGNVWGFTGLYGADQNDQATYPSSQFFSSEIVTQEWCEAGDKLHRLHPTTSDNAQVSAYGLERPDGTYAVMLINMDSVGHTAKIQFSDTSLHAFSGSVTEASFSAANYVWHVKGANGYPSPDGPLSKETLTGGSGASYALPPHSIVVLKGTIQ